MQRSAFKMKGLIDALYQYSRATSHESGFAVLDLNEVVRDVLLDLKDAIAHSRGSVEIRPLPVIQGDKSQMRQLFRNLISNGLKFAAKGFPPRISIDSRLRGNGFWEIFIEDNGVGFDDKYADRIFKPFERLHSESDFPGNGIGLAICHKIVTRHRGKISARGSVGKGACFIVTLPQRQAEHPRGGETANNTGHEETGPGSR
jgi:light-regulated signal transduction histidine kinase (bacteriophytochrome)